MFLLAAVSFIFAGCHKDHITVQTNVKVLVNDFSISQENISGTKDAIASYNGVKAVTLAFYTTDGTEQYKTTQFRDSASTYTTFGEFDLTLPMGSYTMVVLGYGLNSGEPAVTLTSPTSATFGEYPAREAFAATQTVNITTTDAVNFSATLSRINSKLRVVSTDVRTANAASVRMTFAAGGKSFNPTTGLATSNTGFSNTVAISSAVGTTSMTNSYLFLSTDQQTMTVTIDVLDADGESVSHKVVDNVPFQRNAMTQLTGSLYTSSAGIGFMVNTSWIDTVYVNF